MPLQVRAILAALLSALLLLGNAIAVSADVVSNVRVELGPFTTFNNPCDPSDGPLTVTVIEHRVTRIQSDGTVVLHINAHGTAVGTNGTSYEIMRTFSQVDAPGPGGTTTEIFIRRISHGAGDNALIVMTIAGTTLASTRCVG